MESCALSGLVGASSSRCGGQQIDARLPAVRAFLRGPKEPERFATIRGSMLDLVSERKAADVAVEVTNSTPEPDGSHKYYILRVPPTITTCRAVVTWTFGMMEADYDPDIET